jgi:hypothetical protein
MSTSLLQDSEPVQVLSTEVQSLLGPKFFCYLLWVVLQKFRSLESPKSKLFFLHTFYNPGTQYQFLQWLGYFFCPQNVGIV